MQGLVFGNMVIVLFLCTHCFAEELNIDSGVDVAWKYLGNSICYPDFDTNYTNSINIKIFRKGVYIRIMRPRYSHTDSSVGRYGDKKRDYILSPQNLLIFLQELRNTIRIADNYFSNRKSIKHFGKTFTIYEVQDSRPIACQLWSIGHDEFATPFESDDFLSVDFGDNSFDSDILSMNTYSSTIEWIVDVNKGIRDGHRFCLLFRQEQVKKLYNVLEQSWNDIKQSEEYDEYLKSLREKKERQIIVHKRKELKKLQDLAKDYAERGNETYYKHYQKLADKLSRELERQR